MIKPNNLFVEAIQDLLRKYEKKAKESENPGLKPLMEKSYG